MATEIIWRSEDAPAFESASEHFVVQCYLEGQTPFEPWTAYAFDDPTDEALAISTADNIIDTNLTDPMTAMSRRILATRVCKVTV